MKVSYSKTMCLLLACLAAFSACSDESSPVSSKQRSPRTYLLRPDGTGDYPTIQDAIDAAEHGDTIVLANGRYRGVGNRDLDFRGLGIVLRSQSGDPVFCVIDSEGSPQEPHRGMWFHSGETGATVLKGLTIEGGYTSDDGAAILCEDGSSPTINNVVISSNRPTAVTVLSSSPTLENCVFQSNSLGALACRNESSVTLVNCSFVGNINDVGSGGGIMNSSSTLTLMNCFFKRNTAALSGGAMICSAVSGGFRPSLDASSCAFLDNTAAYHGGAINCNQTDFSIRDCTFSGNRAGINGGAFWCYFESSGSVTGSLYYGNDATKGAAINTGEASTLSIQNTIIAFNTGSAAIRCDTLLGALIPQLSCSDIYANEGGDWTEQIAGQLGIEGNISADPLFCDPQADDFRLQPGSPCVSDGECGLKGPWGIGCGSAMLNSLIAR